ncbi:Chaperone protein dnaJ [Didymosphaeria variabile]|uniref:Chaperone protein dnaJ n=1 Tax=Didymosphaeria variabile TaxID=1932322 RepID=A0A9W9CDD5_9PLEO|nr:Chaperone protein dnaJ [Didymosphaeria variabile]KAJ4357636.1 Chaperone protein dnaJ [Didymosphaeria variabile]
MSAKASGSDARSNGDAKHRQHHDGSSGRAYTVEQKAAVIRIKRCAPTAFYEILGLEEVKTTCSEGEIKKAYRKLSLLTHPDKNGYEGADEAFKMVSRAFQVLSDADKKAKYDKFGGDPDARFQPPGGGASGFSNFARSQGGGRPGPMFEEEISPEEMFRQFFGGGGPFGGPFGGGIFDTGPGFVFNLGGGGPGIRVHQFGGGQPRRRPGTARPAGSEPAPSIGSTLSSLLPLFFLFLLPLLSSIFGGDSTPKGPSIVFDGPRGAQTHPLYSENLQVPYWVNKRDLEGLSKKELKNIHKQAESKFIQITNSRCDTEKYKRSQAEQDAYGWFGPDKDKLTKARSMPMPNCKKMKDMGFQVYY